MSNNRGFINCLSTQCRVLNRALLEEKSKPPLFPVCVCVCMYVCVCVCVCVVVVGGGVYKWLVQIILWLAQRLETSKIMETWEMLLIWIWFSWAGGVWGAVLLFIPYLWKSKIHFDIHNSFLDIQKSIYGYPKIHFWISKNQLNIGYP